MMQIAKLLSCVIIGVFISGCASSNNQSSPKFASDQGYYTASFPTRDVSRKLTTIQASILRITSTSIYATYFFDDSVRLTLDKLKNNDVSQLASTQSIIDQSKAGTAVAILQNDRHLALMTAQHVLFAPDTLLSYKQGADIPQNKFIHSVGIKTKQRNYLHTYDDLLEVDILATNTFDDLALIKVDRPSASFNTPPLSLRTGSAKNLKFGSFLYVFGYPLGTPMITRGIVSAPDYDDQGNFLTDALFNHGISGGLIVASRDNFNSFEWVGMSVTASASEQYFLVPDPARRQEYQNLETYTDTAFISQRNIINYGVTQATPIEKILRFLYSNNDKLNRIGLSVTDLGGQ